MKLTTICAFVFVGTTMLTGCETTRTWNKPGATSQDFNQDMARCRMQATASVPAYRPPQQQARTMAEAAVNVSAEMQSRADRDNFLKDCMASNGWYLSQ